MNFQIHMNEMQEAFRNIYTEKKATKISCSKQFGVGSFHFQKLNNIVFAKQNYHFQNHTKIVENTTTERCFLSINVAGNNNFEISNQKTSYSFYQDKIYLGFSQEGEQHKIHFEDKNILRYSFVFSRELLHEYLTEFDNVDLINKVAIAKQFDIFNQISLSPSHRYLIEKIANNPYHGSLKNLYFETTANELLITLLRDLSAKKVKHLILDDRDKVQLIKAKQTLLQDIQNPPTIKELAHLSAINTDKLAKGFKILFGNTIYQTLSLHRMDIAYNSINNNDLSIQEIAYDVGYINVSHFIAAFKKQYGRTPGQMRKEKSF